MDKLRARRPTYTPRTGFAWPISDPSLPEEGRKTTDEDEESEKPSPTQMETDEQLPDETDVQAGARKIATPGDGKKRQNNMLLFNAMRTTALHANQSFTIPAAAAEKPVEDAPPPAAEASTRLSPTPAPIPPRVPTPKSASSAPTPQEPLPARGLPGAGKKKKKRTYYRRTMTLCYLQS